MEDESIGRRIARYRKARGLTQRMLAEEAGLSTSMLKKVEQGSRDVTQPVAAAVARALSLDLATVAGQPYDREGPTRDHVHDSIPPLRRALSAFKLPVREIDAPRTAAAVLADAREIARLRQLDRNTLVAGRLSPLLDEALTLLPHSKDESERALVTDALMALLHAAHSVTYKLGYEDLSVVVEDRIDWLAAKTGDPHMAAFADYARTTSLMRNLEYENGILLLDRARDGIEAEANRNRDLLRTIGSLHLRSAIITARANRFDDATAHIAEAQQIAAHLPADTPGDWQNLAFGKTNVDIHAVATAVEAGDGPKALALADDLHMPEDMSARIPTRVAHHYMDLARAQLWQGRNDMALVSLETAKQAAPQQTRHHPTTREVTRMLVRAHRRANEPLARFSQWLGHDLDL